MKLKTILIFAIVGLIFSAPMLFNKNRPANHQPHQITNSSPSDRGGIVGWLFGDSSPEPSGASSSPFRFAGNQTTTMYSPAGGTPSIHSPGITGSQPALSEPVYHAFVGLHEFLRFDISPDWLKTRWQRVSTFPGESNLTAMRVALVSGPRPVDIHGSLTYFFDDQQRVQRISFKGWTGDASELAGFFQQAGFQRQSTNGAALFTQSSWGKLKGALRLDHPPVSSRDLPNEQLMVLFELTNPRGSYQVSLQTQAIMNAMETRK